MKLNEKIKAIRKARHYSQEELGIRLIKMNDCGISRQTVSDWENGNSEPKLNNIRDLAEVLDVSFDALLDENIDLTDQNTLNAVLKHLKPETKGKINNSTRYHIYAYNVNYLDYLKLISFCVLNIIGIILGIVGICYLDEVEKVGTILLTMGATIFIVTLLFVQIPVQLLNKIIRGGDYVSFGTLSSTHLVIIDEYSSSYDKTIYVPVSQIDKMELAPNASNRHGRVLVYVKDRNKPFETNDIINPEELVNKFNNLEIMD